MGVEEWEEKKNIRGKSNGSTVCRDREKGRIDRRTFSQTKRESYTLTHERKGREEDTHIESAYRFEHIEERGRNPPNPQALMKRGVKNSSGKGKATKERHPSKKFSGVSSP